jgi:hypothetical protein
MAASDAAILAAIAAIDARIAKLQEARAVIANLFGPGGVMAAPAPPRKERTAASAKTRIGQSVKGVINTP